MPKTITSVILAMSRDALRDRVASLSETLPREEFIAQLTPDYIRTAGSIGATHSADTARNELGGLYDDLHNPRYRVTGNGRAGRHA